MDDQNSVDPNNNSDSDEVRLHSDHDDLNPYIQTT